MIVAALVHLFATTTMTAGMIGAGGTVKGRAWGLLFLAWVVSGCVLAVGTVTG